MMATERRETWTLEARAARLDAEVERYVRDGYRVVTRTPTTAQLVKPKQFSVVWALVGLVLFLFIGLLVYLFLYWRAQDATAYLSVDERGEISAKIGGARPSFRPGAGAQAPIGRVEVAETGALICGRCGRQNASSRAVCKSCRAPLHVT